MKKKIDKLNLFMYTLEAILYSNMSNVDKLLQIQVLLDRYKESESND